MTQTEIEKLEQIIDSEITAIAYGEIFFEIDVDDNRVITSNGDMNLDEFEFSDINFYEVAELEVEDDIGEFIKDVKKSLKTINTLNSKSMYLFKSDECWFTSEESVSELMSITFHIENPCVELYLFKQVKIHSSSKQTLTKS